MGKEAIRYGKNAYDIIEFRYFIGIRIWQYDEFVIFCDKNDNVAKNSYLL